jgi:hypothetical protein
LAGYPKHKAPFNASLLSDAPLATNYDWPQFSLIGEAKKAHLNQWSVAANAAAQKTLQYLLLIKGE